MRLNTIKRLNTINRLVITACALAAAAIVLPGIATAQTGTIRGRVIETGSGRPLGEVQVYVDGADRGAITDASGNYVLSNVVPGHRIVRTRRVGYSPVSREIDIAAGTSVPVDLTLNPAVISLDQVVVTGVPTETSKRTLGNAITTIDASSEVAKTVTLSVPELLAARAPGVTVLQSSGTPGAAGTIRIRGIGSVTGATAPVVYIDGVRIASGAAGNFRNSWRGPSTDISTRSTGDGQDASLLGDLNPEDIESVEVIKGPAAATLYGADAANGVIQIITKRGSAGEQKPQWRGRFQAGQSNWSVDKRTNYTTCDAARIAAGPSAWPGCVGQTPGTVLTYTGLAVPGVLRGGRVGESNLSLTGGGQGYSYFTAVTQSREQGVVTNSENTLKSGRANFAFYPTQHINYAVNVAYSQSNIRFPMGDDGGNLLQAAWTYVPGKALLAGQQVGFAGGPPVNFSVYDNRLRTDRVTIGSTLNVNPFTWFANRLIVGADMSNGLANRYIAPGSLWAPNEGQMTQGEPRNNIYTVNYAGTISTPFPLRPSLTSALSFGAQYTNSQFRNTLSQGNDFASASIRDINLAAVRTGWSEFVDT
jgi:TonB-dependent SusC/RagA subfamily outer membrane receptor